MFELSNFFINSAYYTKENFSDFTAKMNNSFKHQDLIWNTFAAKERGLSPLPLPPPRVEAFRPEKIERGGKVDRQEIQRFSETKSTSRAPTPTKFVQKAKQKLEESANFL